MSGFSRINKYIICFMSLLANTYAADSFPRGCEVTGYGYSQNYLLLNETGKQAYYLIQNRSNVRIELEHIANAEAFMTPQLRATLDPMAWGAFAADVKNLPFKCSQPSGESKYPVDCREVLDICQYPRVRFALSNMGSYWVSIIKSQAGVIQDSVAKGIYLKW